MTETWFGALLFSVTSVVSVQANECTVGVIGERVSLPCVYAGVKNLTSFHISSEWRRGMETVHTADWMEGQLDKQNVSHSIRTTVSSLALNTGDFSMELHDVHLADTHNYSFHLKLRGQRNSFLVCTTCLTVAGHFSHPTLIRENGVEGDESRFFCYSTGGFPAPSIYWLVNQTQRPPETSITTYINTLPHSELYNVTSVLSINISTDTAVSCVIENDLLNETLTATDFGIRLSTRRLSKHIWPFTTALCVVVFLLVATSLSFQRKWDRERKQHSCRDDSSCEDTDMIVFDREKWASLPETDV